MSKIITLLLLISMPNWLFSQLYINEFMAKNESVLADLADNNQFNDWIEIYNAGNDDVNIGGYFITDHIGVFEDYSVISENAIVPAGGYLLLWANKDQDNTPLHTNFKLSSNGEFIGLYNAAAVLVDSLTFPAQFADISMGRAPDGAPNFVFFENPTPLAENPSTGTTADIAPPTYGFAGGFFDGSISVTLGVENDDVIYYTTNGNEPTAASPIYSVPLVINETTVVRAIAIKSADLKSSIVSNTYFINQNYSLPVLDIAIDSAHLYGPTGIYSNPNNFGPEWERFCQSTYFLNDTIAFQANAGLRIQGNSSVILPKKSFRMFFKKKYGTDQLDFPLFGENNGVDKFEKIVLRSGYDDDVSDSLGTLLRDPVGSQLFEEIGGLVSSSKWSVLTLNGNFWGIYDLRESVNDEFIKDHIGTKEFDMVRFKGDGEELKNGTIDDWNELKQYIQTNDITQDIHYDLVAEKIDIDKLIDLMSFVQFSSFKSWGYGVSTYKENADNGKWKWTIWDMDRAFGTPYDDILTWWETAAVQNPGILWANFLPRAFLKNDIFSKKFMNRQADLLNTVFKEESAMDILQQHRDLIAPEIPKEYQKWNSVKDFNWWDNNVDRLDFYFLKRPGTIRNHFKWYYDLTGFKHLNLSVEGNGSLHINSIDVPSSPWSGIYFEGVPVTITATPDVGYKFVHWNNGMFTTPVIEIDVNDVEDLVASFELITSDDCEDIMFCEIMYNPADDNTGKDWIEIYNNTNSDRDLSDWVFRDGNDAHGFVIPDGTTIDAKAYLVLARELEKFTTFYPAVENVIGDFGMEPNGFGLSNSGDELYLFTANGCIVDYVKYEDKEPWPEEADGAGPSLELISFDNDNNLANSWQKSIDLNGTPGSDTVSMISTEVQDILPALDVFPNPSEGLFEITWLAQKSGIGNFWIYNALGQVIWKQEVLMSSRKCTVDLSGIEKQKGLYFLGIETENGSLVRKITIY